MVQAIDFKLKFIFNHQNVERQPLLIITTYNNNIIIIPHMQNTQSKCTNHAHS